MTKKQSKKIFLALVVILAIGKAGWLYHDFTTSHRKATIVIEGIENAVVNSELTVPIVINTNNETINAAEIYLHFDSGAVEVKSVSKDGSFFQIWITDQPSYSNTEGTISFAGGLPTPGFHGTGKVGSVTLIPKRSGRTVLTFDSKTRILKNDGLGTSVALAIDPIEIQVR